MWYPAYNGLDFALVPDIIRKDVPPVVIDRCNLNLAAHAASENWVKKDSCKLLLLAYLAQRLEDYRPPTSPRPLSLTKPWWE